MKTLTDFRKTVETGVDPRLEYKFKETKDITPTRDKVSSEWRLLSKMNFVTFRSTYHSSCYRKAGP